jgi:peptidoglycan/LPS O-acetylase OafA/YrhL
MGYAQPIDLQTSAPIVRADPMRADGEKLLGLELLRFASALAVLFFHYRHFAHATGAGAINRDAVPLHAVLWPLYEYGLYGVQVFWGISGYIFFWKYGTAIRSGVVAARDFFWLRFSRLYPLHIATLIGVVGLQAIHRQVAGVDFVYPATDPGLFVRQIFLATDWATQPPFSFNGPIWSISAEVAVYATFFILLRFITPSMKLCVGVIVACLVAQMAGLRWVSIGCASYFFAGGLAALAPREWRRPAGAMLFILILAGVTTGILADRGKLPTILLIAVPCLLMLASRGWNGLDRWQKPIQAAGNLTYSSYLLHFPLQLLVVIAATASGLALPLTNPLFLLAYIVGTLAVAALSYRAFEVPLQNWLRRRVLKAGANA